MYVYVSKDNLNKFQVEHVINYTKNVRGKSGITYGDITILDLETRKAEGFWEQIDIYEGQGEFKIFKDITTVFDEVKATVTNTYNYVYMPIGDIKNEMKNRVDIKRDGLNNSTINYKTYVFKNDNVFKTNLLMDILVFTNNPAAHTSDYNILDANGNLVKLTIDDLKAIAELISSSNQTNIAKAITIKSNIDAAQTIDATIAAARWDNEQL